MARSITSKKAFNPFLSKLATDVKNICTTSSLLVPADKTTNLYKISTQDYEKLLHDNIAADYSKGSDNATKQINIEAKGLVCNLNLDNRIDKIAEKPAFITLKDHKPNCYNNPKCRLINPATSDIGVISKVSWKKSTLRCGRVLLSYNGEIPPLSSIGFRNCSIKKTPHS